MDIPTEFSPFAFTWLV